MEYSKQCLHCGKIYYKGKNQSINNWENRSKFCSRSCLQKWKIKNLQTGVSSRFLLGHLPTKGMSGKRPWNKKYENGVPLEIKKEWNRRSSEKYDLNPLNHIKRKARQKLNDTLRAKKILKTPCEICNNPKVEAHHHLGYEPEHWLDVKWLCKKHHHK